MVHQWPKPSGSGVKNSDPGHAQRQTIAFPATLHGRTLYGHRPLRSVGCGQRFAQLENSYTWICLSGFSLPTPNRPRVTFTLSISLQRFSMDIFFSPPLHETKAACGGCIVDVRRSQPFVWDRREPSQRLGPTRQRRVRFREMFRWSQSMFVLPLVIPSPGSSIFGVCPSRLLGFLWHGLPDAPSGCYSLPRGLYASELCFSKIALVRLGIALRLQNEGRFCRFSMVMLFFGGYRR